VERPESRSLGLPPARLLSVSSTGELAILLKAPGDLSDVTTGTLARIPLSGGEPRKILEDVLNADWSPDGRELAVVRRVRGELQLECPIGNVLGRPGRPFWIRVSPRGDRIAVVEIAPLGEAQGITLYDRAGRKIPVQTPRMVWGLAWPSDDALWFTAGEAFVYRSVWRTNPAGPPREMYRDLSNLTLHDASNDGRLLVHHGFERAGVKAKAPGDKDERELGVFMCSWARDLSADGSRVLVSDGDAPVQTYVRPTRGGPSVRLARARRWRSRRRERGPSSPLPTRIRGSS
jgi:hypothetical protein